MKTLHVTFSFPPEPPAGTEIYVAALCRGLADRGVECVVAAPSVNEATYEVDGTRVRRFATAAPPSLRELYAGADPVAAAGFERLLDEERPDLLHQHALTFACSTALMRAARRRGVPIVFTYHTPTTTCQRGTLLEYGGTVCDGRVGERCTSCTLHGLGMNRTLGRLVARAPVPVTAWLGEHVAWGRVSTALCLPGAMRARACLVSEFLSLPDRFVALTPWVKELLCANGVHADRVAMSRHGLSDRTTHACASGVGPLRIAHLGRLDPVKGTVLLIRAVRATVAPLQLDIYGLLQGPADRARLTALDEAIGGDPRIRVLPALAPKAVVDALAEYDLVAVPSQWLETGPLVVLEAHAAGTPVVGSALGGIADKVRDGVDGLLVAPHASVEAWRAALDRLAGDRALLATLKQGVRPPRSLSAVVEDMRDLYAALVPTRTFRAAV